MQDFCPGLIGALQSYLEQVRLITAIHSGLPLKSIWNLQLVQNAATPALTDIRCHELITHVLQVSLWLTKVSGAI